MSIPGLLRSAPLVLVFLLSCSPDSGQSGSEVLCTPGTQGDSFCEDSVGSTWVCGGTGVCVDSQEAPDAGVDDGCSTSAECTVEGEGCFGPNEPQACGIPPAEECVSDAECPAAVCHAMVDSCSADGIGSRCGPACTPGSCGGSLRCGAGGACEAIACDDGLACPVHQDCDPGRIAADAVVHDKHHGCFNVQCGPQTCGAGFFCVNSVCQQGPGQCEEPLEVP